VHNLCSKASPPLAIGGIKVSPVLVQFNLFHHASGLSALSIVFRRIAEERINLSFLTLGKAEHGVACSFCVAENDAGRTQRLMEQTVPEDSRFSMMSRVGTVSLFPHHDSLVLVGTVLKILGAARIPVYALCTSLSAVAVCIDYHLIDRAIVEFRKFFDLPANHAPFHPEAGRTPDEK
jgi:aspartokinase